MQRIWLSFLAKFNGRAIFLRAWIFAHVRLLIIGLGGIVLVGLGILAIYLSRAVSVRYAATNLFVNAPITVSFDKPVAGSVKPSISPRVAGKWFASHNFWGGVTKLTFVPDHMLAPGTVYKVQLADFHPILGLSNAGTAKTVSLKTEQRPSIKVVSPAKPTDVAVNSLVEVSLQNVNHGIRRLRLVSSDAKLVNAVPSSGDDRSFVWRFDQALAQSAAYHLKVIDLNLPADQQVVALINFSTVNQPQIIQATATDHFYPSQAINISFDQDMLTDTDKISFDCNGSGQWQDSRHYQYTPATLTATKSCSYTIPKGAKAKLGGVVEADHTYTVSAPGAAYVSTQTPGGSGLGLSSPITVTFDQPVDHSSAQAAFSLSPAVAGNFSWNNNTMIYQPNGLDYQTNYTFSIAPGVKAIYGLTGVKAFSASFNTLVQTIKLGVPYYKQIHALSCEEASLRMALAYRGISVSDDDVLNQVGYNPHPRDTITNTWDNPNKMYVGDVNGTEGVTGWGVYGGPIATAAQHFGRGASYIQGITVQQISQAIHDNNPVVLWGMVAGQSPIMDSWNTTDGVVQVVKNAHVRTVYGVYGSASNPLGFYVHDPIYGDLYWTTSQIQYNMTAGGQIGSQGVVVQ